MISFLLGILLDFVLFVFTATAVFTVFGWVGLAVLVGGNVLVLLLHTEARRALRVVRGRT